MKKFNKALVLPVLFLTGLQFVLLPVTSMAAPNERIAVIDPFQSPCSELTDAQKEKSTVCSDTNSEDPITGEQGLATRIISTLSWAIGASSIIIIVYGSIKYILSSGDSAKVSSAKETILYALIGLVIAIIGRGLITFVLSRT